MCSSDLRVYKQIHHLMKHHIENKILKLALLTAIAISLHVVENMIMRLLPIPFIRLGLSNAVALYLICVERPMDAILVTITKSIFGGVATMTLIHPSTLLSLFGGLSSVVAMFLAMNLIRGFSIFGLSIIGAIMHNLVQLVIVRLLIMHTNRVFMLTPILISLGLISGSVIAYVTLYVIKKFEHSGKIIDETLY